MISFQITLRDLVKGSVGRVHGNHERKRGLRIPVFSVFVDEILEGEIGFVFGAPLIDEMVFFARGFRFPIHWIEMTVIGSVGIPELEAVTSMRRTPFIPCGFPTVVVAIDIRGVGSIEMPLTNVSEAVPLCREEIGPALEILSEFTFPWCSP